ncbi:XRE family transcriptional regulator [Xylanimonas protaetiae]|nr:XRE family transcriptional regulator [Xylanimonas protaetiae]
MPVPATAGPPPDGPEPTETLGALVRRLRRTADLTLEGLAAASGVSDRALSDIERGAARGPQHRTMLAVVDALGLVDADRARVLRAAREGRRRPPAEPGGLALPRGVPDFTGRDAELRTLETALRPPHPDGPVLAVVTGPPGYGKTSLAVRAAQRLHASFESVLYLALGEPDRHSPATIAARVVRALTGTEARRGEEPDQLRTALAARRALLVLDDVRAEAQVRALLPATGSSAVLATGRRSLAGLEGAVRVDLGRLPLDDAHALLRRIVPAEQGTAAGVERLVRLCDGVPLALRIAGNRVASRRCWTADAFADRLARAERPLDALVAGDLGVRATIAVSHDLLGPGARRLFRRLALVDAATFGADLAARLAQEPRDDVEEHLDELVSLGLVETAAHDRYALHDLLRLFACEQLAAADDLAWAAHARAAAAVAAAARGPRLVPHGARA